MIALRDYIFQSTPSAWRETAEPHAVVLCFTFQSTPSAWRETAGILQEKSRQALFQSTPSAWRETGERFAICGNTVISIHSLRMEGDAKARLAAAAAIHFNPLPPHGGRRTRIIANAVGAWNFNPLPPHGGRQCDFPGWANGSTISIHSLRMEGDLSGLPHSCAAKSFQSTPSAWRETRRCSTFRRSAVFQSTPSAWRETPLHWQHHALCEYFNPLPPHGGRPRRHATDR